MLLNVNQQLTTLYTTRTREFLVDSCLGLTGLNASSSWKMIEPGFMCPIFTFETGKWQKSCFQSCCAYS